MNDVWMGPCLELHAVVGDGAEPCTHRWEDGCHTASGLRDGSQQQQGWSREVGSQRAATHFCHPFLSQALSLPTELLPWHTVHYSTGW